MYRSFAMSLSFGQLTGAHLPDEPKIPPPGLDLSAMEANLLTTDRCGGNRL